MQALKTLTIIVILGAVGWFGWQKLHTKTDGEGAPAGAMGMMGMQGPMPVSVMTVKSQIAQQWLEFSGTLTAVDTVEVRPRVNGAIQKIFFNPGDIVEKNAPLFLIDPRPYEAEVSRAKAAVASADAQVALAQTELERAERLIRENAIAQRDVNTRQNNSRVALANRQAAVAALEQAQLNLNYATIRAPVRGKISRAEITLGNLVSPTTAAPLATIVSVDSIYADFDVDEKTYVDLVRRHNKGTQEDALPIRLALGQDDVTYTGRIVSFDNKLDPASGTIRVRAIFANKDKVLVPGMFAQIRLGQSQPASVLLIPDRVINTDQDKKFVYVVDAENKIAYRPVSLGAVANNMRIVTEGLQDGDKVVTEGLQKLRPGMLVVPQEAAVKADEAEGDAMPPAPAPTADKAETDVKAPAEKAAEAVETLQPQAAPETTSEAMPAPKDLTPSEEKNPSQE